MSRRTVGKEPQSQLALLPQFAMRSVPVPVSSPRAGVTPKTAQTSARHSDINLTMGVYTQIGVLDQVTAVEALPPVPTAENNAADKLSARGSAG